MDPILESDRPRKNYTKQLFYPFIKTGVDELSFKWDTSPKTILANWQYELHKDTLHMSRLMTKPSKWHVRPAKTQISLGIRPVWSESSLSAWRKLGSSATHLTHSEDSDQTGRMLRLIWVLAGRTVILLVLSRGGSYLCGRISGYLRLRALA